MTVPNLAYGQFKRIRLGGRTGALITGGDDIPQGSVEAPVGSMYVRGNGQIWTKQGGGSTAYGWYLVTGWGGSGMGQGPNLVGWTMTDLTGINAGANMIALNSWANTNNSTLAAVRIDGHMYRKFETGGTINTNSYITSNISSPTINWFSHDFDLVGRLAIPVTITTMRVFFGITSAVITDDDGMTGAVGGATGFISLAYRTPVPDPGWVGMTKNGANNLSVTGQVGAFNAGAPTAVVLRIRFVSTGTPTVYFSVDDGPEVSQTSNIPSSGTFAVPFIIYGGTNKAASTRLYYTKAILAHLGTY